MSKMSQIAIEVDELIARGYSPKEARRKAMNDALIRARAANKNNKRKPNENNIQ